jgi:hypothetical protein
MYDGSQTVESQHKTLLHYYDCLDKVFIIIVNDWNNTDIRNGTINAIQKMRFKVLYTKELRLTSDNSYTPQPLAKKCLGARKTNSNN